MSSAAVPGLHRKEAGADPQQGYRMQGLYRFILALMVLWSHSLATFFPEVSDWLPKLQLGNVAVSSFFVLSGYLMSEAVAIWYSDRPVNFIVNRYLRIGPPLLVAAVVSVVIHVAVFSAGLIDVGIEVVPQGAISVDNAILSLLAPIFPFDALLGKVLGVAPQPYYQFVRYSWAIFTELIFYWALFFYCVAVRYVGAWWISSAFVVATAAMFLVGTGAYQGFFQDTPWADPVARIPFVFHMQWAPHFLLGVMLSGCDRNGWRSPMRLVILSGSALAAAIQLGLYTRQGYPGGLLVLSMYAISLVGGFSLILSGRTVYAIGPFSLDRVRDRGFGNLSYPVYINHYALALAVLAIFHAGGGLPNLSAGMRVVAFACYNLLIVAGAAALIRMTDLVTDRLRDRIRGVVL